jgi:hypothetical protein
MSGILHCEEGDYTTAGSYFLEVSALCLVIRYYSLLSFV